MPAREASSRLQVRQGSPVDCRRDSCSQVSLKSPAGRRAVFPQRSPRGVNGRKSEIAVNRTAYASVKKPALTGFPTGGDRCRLTAVDVQCRSCGSGVGRKPHASPEVNRRPNQVERLRRLIAASPAAARIARTIVLGSGAGTVSMPESA